MINDLPTHSVIPSKKATVQEPNIQQSLVFFLRKVEAKSLQLLW